MVQLNQVFSILTKGAFKSVPPVDGFNNGSGKMNAVQYARDVIGFRAANYEEVVVTKANISRLLPTLDRVKKTLAAGNVVGITISMPNNTSAGNRVTDSRFVGFKQPFILEGGHAMVITDFKNPGGTFGPSPDVNAELKKEIGAGFQFRLKNSWGSSSGVNEFGQVVPSGYYDMDVEYIGDVLMSEYPAKNGNPAFPGFVVFTFPKE